VILDLVLMKTKSIKEDKEYNTAGIILKKSTVGL
jgi:hypothetical protein